MEIVFNKDENLADARLEINISLSDIEKDLNKSLKDLRQKINLPGFRPGMVPMGIAKKYIYEDALANILEKKIDDAMQDYFNRNDIFIFKPAIPVPTEKPLDLKNDQEFRFIFDLGILNFKESDIQEIITGLEKYNVTPSEEDIDLEIKRIINAYSEYRQSEKVEEDEELTIYISLRELDGEGNELENGIQKSKILKFKDLSGNLKEYLLGKDFKTDYMFKVKEIFPSTEEIQSFFEIEKEAAEDISDTFKLRILNISKMVPPEMNEDFYRKATQDKASDEAGLRDFAREMFQRRMENASKHLIEDEITKRLRNIPVNMPEKYLQKLFELEEAEKIKDMSPESENYQSIRQTFFNSAKWMTLIDYLVQKYGITANVNEVAYQTYGYFDAYMRQVGIPNNDENQINNAIVNYLKKKENYLAMEKEVFTGKIIDRLMNEAELTVKEVSSNEFLELYNHKHKDHEH